MSQFEYKGYKLYFRQGDEGEEIYFFCKPDFIPHNGVPSDLPPGAIIKETPEGNPFIMSIDRSCPKCGYHQITREYAEVKTGWFSKGEEMFFKCEKCGHQFNYEHGF